MSGRRPGADDSPGAGTPRLDCPTTLVEVLVVRHVWGVDVLPELPALEEQWAVSLERAANDLRFGQRADHCEQAWAGHVALRRGTPGAEPVAAMRAGPHDSSRPGDDEPLRALRHAVSRVRAQTLAAVRQDGPRDSGAVGSRWQELLGSRPPDEAWLDVIPVAGALRLQPAPGWACVDLASWLGADPPRR